MFTDTNQTNQDVGNKHSSQINMEATPQITDSADSDLAHRVKCDIQELLQENKKLKEENKKLKSMLNKQGQKDEKKILLKFNLNCMKMTV